MKRYYIAANWKMHMTRLEACKLAEQMREGLKDGKNKYMIAPSFTLLQDVAKILQGSNILLGAQNMSSEEKGAHTGEVSVLQLLDVGVKTVILGHSERRHNYCETDSLINKKVKLALRHGLEVILCVGELLEEREAGKAEEVCEAQIINCLADVSAEHLKKVTIAYEPVWAIGTGKNATPEDADLIHSYIRDVLKKMYNEKISKDMIIQYGGSMKPENAEGLLKKENIDGGLIGGAGLKSETFLPIAMFGC